ncbi:MAG: MaoC family dehydratase [bacterium]|nr:MaoC family dehydratase [bacterium]
MAGAIPVAEIGSLIGTEIGVTEWFEIDQDRVNAFADATLDHQFIHVDPQAAAATPFGGTIAHGFLALSLLPHLLQDISPEIAGVMFALNYGTDKVRFLQPVKVGSRIRVRNALSAADEKSPGRWLLKQTVTMEIEGEQKPAMVAELLAMIFVQ